MSFISLQKQFESLSFSERRSAAGFKAFTKMLLSYYKENERAFPWRTTFDPYEIMVSELMLQQTQVDRVSEKFVAFLKKFPTVKKLAAAEQASVLKEWQGLGYNRRARFLHQAAQIIVKEWNGVLPAVPEKLTELPGIGYNTACAIVTYAFNQPVVYIETNVRTVFIHHFFKPNAIVHDDDLIPLIEKTLDKKNPRQWYSALMDYGTFLKKEFGNVSQRSKHYNKQSSFKGSDREIRGAIIRALTKHNGQSRASLDLLLPQFDADRVSGILLHLVREGMIRFSHGRYSV